ncbi:MAG: MmcQ/YjbR family DNA-binding protein [Pseudomonadota bacterium]|nr:MmcQ/YjbR family DNA-binding protein [Pseudomonadota bacterium]
MPVTKAQVKQVALSFAGAVEKPSHGRPAYFVHKTFFTRLRPEDNSVVMRVGSIEQRDMMLELDPQTYFITDHYRDWPVILVRIAQITPTELKTMLERRWRQIAPKKLLREVDGEAAAVKKSSPTPRAKARPAKKRSAAARKGVPARAAKAKSRTN